MILFNGKKLADSSITAFRRQIKSLSTKGIIPGLAVVMVEGNSASEIYVRNKKDLCEKLGIKFKLHRLASKSSPEKIARTILALNQDPKVHGIILQLPLPAGIDMVPLVSLISPLKDSDGLHPFNMGLLAMGRPMFVPATAQGIFKLIDAYKIKVKGKRVLMIGFGAVAGMPISLMLANRKATVTIAQDATKDLKTIALKADVIITAVGKPKLIKANMVKRGVIVIDAGSSKLRGKLAGDVDFANVSKKAKYLTPVPGGVGPLTVSSLVANVLRAAEISATKG
ncbi:bifunctional 5,10-methylenetetrahydrofolate dehydrogenase/5,10-methenyltetrahydrofolate cyclohydrolase [Patescibacteria group bacterium]|nr:bifunctional 5,10-methylenetetrahydrofolate dehydrogenase/5,10-methenyltetrahydrofolate cyclohydrolase [Patescibacteria group bacterium]